MSEHRSSSESKGDTKRSRGGRHQLLLLLALTSSMHLLISDRRGNEQILQFVVADSDSHSGVVIGCFRRIIAVVVIEEERAEGLALTAVAENGTGGGAVGFG